MTDPTARWTVDDEFDLTFSDGSHLYGHMTATAHAALRADVEAARAHEDCAHTTDTLRQARELAAQLRGPRFHPEYYRWCEKARALLDLLVDWGGDG